MHIIIARIWNKTDLGIFTIAFSFLTLFSTVGSLGLSRGVTRNLAYYIGKKESKILPDIIFSSITITIIASTIIAIILFTLSNYIAVNIFEEPSLALPLMLFSIAIPINNIITIFVSIFRGFKDIKPLVYFQQITQNVLFFLFLILLGIKKSSFIYVFYLYLLSQAITCILIVLYSKNRITRFDILSKTKTGMSQAKPLIFFSLPLLGVAILNTSTNWINTLMLGGLKTAADVGLYKVAVTVAGFVAFPIGILLVLYMPVVSNLYGADKKEEIKRMYTVLTKWLCFLTFPLFLFLFLFSTQAISIIYGKGYAFSSNALKILLVGAIFTNFSGPNGATLISIGKTKKVMYSIFISSIVNVVLNIFLIPTYGIEGAAVSVTISIIVFNILKSRILYLSTKATSFSYNLIKPSIFIISLTMILYVIIKEYFVIDYPTLVLFFILLYLVYFVLFLVTISIDKEDIDIIEIIGKKIHLNLDFITKIMKKFLS